MPWRKAEALGTKELAGTAMLSALAALLEFLPMDLPYPLFPFVTLDPVGIPIALAGILYGPTAGLVTVGVGGLTIVLRSGDLPSASFKAVAEAATVLPLALILWSARGRLGRGGRGAWIVSGVAWTAAVTSRVAVMSAYNYYFLQVFPPHLSPEVALLLLPVLAGFNAVQGALNVVPAHYIASRLPPDLKPEWLSPPAD